MAVTIDHLRTDHRVTVLRDFTDAVGITMREGESGILRRISFDAVRLQIRLDIELASGTTSLTFPLKAETGPRNGHMREFFELGEDVTLPRDIPAFRAPQTQTMIVPPPEAPPAQHDYSEWDRRAQSTEGPDRLEDLEQEMLKAIPHLGVAASIAEVYARRMRAFQRAGNEARAAAAFRLAVDWMGNYASSATSGGEGAALSYERDKFRAALIREFGYDPTERKG